MNRALLATTLSFLYAAPAFAGSVLVWLDDSVPDPKYVKKAEHQIGSAVHLAYLELAFPPQALSDRDQARYEALRSAVIKGKAIWDDFDVEYGIATELEGILFGIDVVRDKRDLQDLVDARLFEGAASVTAFSPKGFWTDPQAAAFRVELGGTPLVSPWVQAAALVPDRTFVRTDVADGATFPALSAQQKDLADLPDGVMDLSGLPDGVSLVVDGHPVEHGATEISLRPGLHYVHGVRRGVVGGRQRVTAVPGERLPTPVVVDRSERDAARAALLSGATATFPPDVRHALTAIGEHFHELVRVATVEDGKVVIGS